MGKYSEKVDLGDDSWGKMASTDKQNDVIIGSDTTGDHCHIWHDKEKDDVGVVHRGHCADCKENESGGK